MNIGGQAVVEGVMMRNKENFAVAVRLPNGTIKVKKEKSTAFPKLFNVILIRGIVGLLYMLVDGMKALIWSSNQQLGKEEKLTNREIFFALAASLLFAVVFFVGLPFFSAHLIYSEGLWFNALDGMIRVLLFVLYVSLISHMKDVKTLFRYHGAEHMAIYCHEAKKRVTVQNVRQFEKEHHRCGTSFIFMVLLVSIILFSFISGPWWVKLLSRIVLLPVIVGISYELIKLGDRHRDNLLMKVFLAPGLWLQKITTRKPTDKQIQVAIASLQAVVR